MCCFFSPSSTYLLNLAVCVYSLVKAKTKKQKQNLHARAREQLLHVSSLTERRAGYLLTTFTWINVCTHMSTNIYTCKQMCVVQHQSFPCLWSFENLCSNMWMMGQALGKCPTGSAPPKQVGSEYRWEPSRNGEGIYVTTLCQILSEEDCCLQTDLLHRLL